jgi:hypothetical protein
MRRHFVSGGSTSSGLYAQLGRVLWQRAASPSCWAATSQSRSACRNDVLQAMTADRLLAADASAHSPLASANRTV